MTAVVLDLSDALSVFWQQIKQCQRHDYSWTLVELLNEVIKYLQDVKTAQEGLQALQQDIVLYSDYFGTEGAVIAPAVGALASAFYWHITACRLYDRNGHLHYEVGTKWPDKVSLVLVLVDGCDFNEESI